jgi:tetratricopeptide (TPR) repeat protein/type II secretory pathway predicted ATPase ExeA
MTDLEVYNKILGTFRNKKRVLVVGSILSGLTFTRQKLLQKNIPENQVCQISGRSFTDDDEKKLSDSLKMIAKSEQTKLVLLAPEYFVSYVVSKLSDQAKQIDKSIKEKNKPIQLIVTEQEAHNIANEILCNFHKDLLVELPQDCLSVLESVWVEHARRKLRGQYTHDYETHLPALIKSEIEETGRHWVDFKRYGASNSKEFAILEAERLKKKRREFSAVLTASGISAALLGCESRAIIEAVENLIGIILPGFALAAFGGATSLLIPALVRDIRKWWKGGRQKVNLEEFLTTVQYWNEFTIEERRLLCYEFDQQKKLRPGKSFEDLSRVFGGFDAEKLEEIQKRQDNLQNEINKLNSQKTDFESEMGQLEEKCGKLFGDLEQMNLDVKEIDLHIRAGFDKVNWRLRELNISIFEQCGLNLLHPNYFENHKSADRWKKCFPFELADVKAGKEFRRKILEKLKSMLEEKKVLVMVGEKGTGKSVILKEIMCDYFEKGYRVLYNDFAEMKRPELLQKFIENEVDSGENVLIAVDNAHLQNNAATFRVMQDLLTYRHSEKVRLIVAATLPEFDILLNEKLSLVAEPYRESLLFFKYEGRSYRFEIPYFELEDVKAFVRFYRSTENPITIFKETRGHPILVFWEVFGQGLELDVERRYQTYLKENGEPIPGRIVVTLVCSILDIADNGATQKMLDEMKLIDFARSLKFAILYKRETNIWNTLHSAWAVMFIKYLYPSNEGELETCFRNKKYLEEALDNIFALENERLTIHTIDAMVDLADFSFLPIHVVREVVKIPRYVSNENQAKLYALSIGGLLLHKRCFNDALACIDKAIELNRNDAEAYCIKGICLTEMGKREEALTFYDKAIELDPNYVEAYGIKAKCLDYLGRLEEALVFHNKAIDLDPRIPALYNNKALCLSGLRRSNEALVCFDKAIDLDPHYADAYNNKAILLYETWEEEEEAARYFLTAAVLRFWDNESDKLKIVVPLVSAAFFGNESIRTKATVFYWAADYLTNVIDKEECIARIEEIPKQDDNTQSMLSALNGEDKPLPQIDVISEMIERLRKAILQKVIITS